MKKKVNKKEVNIEDLKIQAIEILSRNSLATLSSLVRVASIEESNIISTACILRKDRHLCILYNREFVQNFANTPIKFAGLISHEIFHEIFKHLEFLNYKGNQEIWNIAMDCVIQSTLNSMSRTPQKVSYYMYTGIPDTGFDICLLFREFYEMKGITGLLRPPNPLKRLRRSETTEDPELDKLRANIYPLKDKWDNKTFTTSKLSETDIYNFLIRNCPKVSVKLIGGIGESEETIKKVVQELNSDPSSPSKYSQNLDTILSDKTIEDISQEIDKKAGSSTVLSQAVTKLKKSKSLQLEYALDKALMEHAKSKVVAGVGGNARPSRSVVLPTALSNSDFLKLCAGSYPLFFSRPIKDVKKVKANVYIDVSYSTKPYLEWMYGCIEDLKRLCDLSLYIFSNKVESLSLDQLSKGLVLSTGGTDFDCIANHSLEPRNEEIKKALIFTDGYASMSNRNVERVKKKNITYIGAIFTNYTGDDNTYVKECMKPFCTTLVEVPYPNQGEN